MYIINKILSRIINSKFPKILKYLDTLCFSFWDDNPFKSLKESDIALLDKKYNIAKASVSDNLKNFCYLKSPKIPHKFIHKLAYITQTSKKNSDLNYDHGYLLYAYVYDLALRKKPLYIIETGTARGFSSIIMSKAIDDANSYGTIITFDILPHNKKMFWNSPSDIIGTNSRNNLLKDYSSLTDKIIFQQANTRINIERTHLNRIHFAFLDGAHEMNDILKEGKFVSDRQKKGDLIIFDDFNELLFPGVVKGVKKLCNELKYKCDIAGGKNNRSYAICKKL